MFAPLPISLRACRSFAARLGLTVKGRGPSFYVASDVDGYLAVRLTVSELADYLESYDLAQITAAGPCCPLYRIGTA
jgi:hypothetical protein